MAKRSKLILFLSLLLCFSMLFASCDTPEPTPTTEAQTTKPIVENPDATLEDQTPDYEAMIKEWNKYIAYNEPETDALTATKELFSFSSADAPYTVSWHGNLVYFNTLETVEFYTHTSYTECYRIYSVDRGEIFATTDSYSSGNRNKYYQFEFLYEEYGIDVVAVKITTHGEIPDEPQITYSYYAANGVKLPTNVESDEPLHSITYLPNSDIGLVIEDKFYICRDGDIIYTFKRGEERLLPVIDFEHAGYKYAINANENTVSVFDTTYELLAQYTLPTTAYVEDAMRVMANGNLFFQWTVETIDETNFDFEDDGCYYLLKQVMLDVETGEATEIDMKAFVSDEKADKEEKKEKEDKDDKDEPAAEETPKSIRYYFTDLISNGTIRNTTVKMVNDEEQLAIGYAIVDGKPANEASFLIVDSAFNIKAILPNFWINQTANIFFAEKDKLIVSTDVLGEVHYYWGDYSDKEQIYYAIDTKKQDAPVLFADCSSEETIYKFIDGGLIYQDKIYNNDFEELMDLSEVEERYNGDVILYNAENEQGETETNLCYIKNGQLIVKVLVPAGGRLVESTQDYYRVSLDLDGDSSADLYKLYNRYGEELLSAEYLSVFRDTEDGVIVSCRTTYSDETIYRYNIVK